MLERIHSLEMEIRTETQGRHKRLFRNKVSSFGIPGKGRRPRLLLGCPGESDWQAVGLQEGRHCENYSHFLSSNDIKPKGWTELLRKRDAEEKRCREKETANVRL
jgi:hypothetical protein